MTPPQLPDKRPQGTWVQTDRATHEAWGQLSIRHPAASALLHYFAGRVGEHNAVVISQSALARATGLSKSTVKRALAVLREGRWIDVARIGPTGTAAAYIINDRVVWHGKRDGIRHSLFTATVVAASDEQDNEKELGSQEPLRRLPRLYSGERQNPTGQGLPPPSEPPLPGMEPDLPSIPEGDDVRHARARTVRDVDEK